ncbi:uncharacterized protein LOC144931626 [Lampetra fluviatilis]
MASHHADAGDGAAPLPTSDAAHRASPHDSRSTGLPQAGSDAAPTNKVAADDASGKAMTTESVSAGAVGPPGCGSSSEGADGGSASRRSLGGVSQIDAKSRTRAAHWNVRALDEEGKAADTGRPVEALQRHGLRGLRHKTGRLGSKDGRLQLGVGIAVSNRMEKHVSKFEPVDERIVLLRLKFKVCQRVTVIEAYAPSEPAEEDSRKRFYNKLQEILESVPKHDVLLRRWAPTMITGGTSLGLHRMGPKDANGMRLLKFCSGNKLVVCNTQFQQKNSRKFTWVSPEDQTERRSLILLSPGSNTRRPF